MASAVPQEPMLVIIGATGTGKSKVIAHLLYLCRCTYYCRQLAVELAARFNGEIINGDAMQMYKGLPIITNKMPDDEQNDIPHHLMDFIGLEEEPWTVGHFVDEAQKVVKEIRSRGKLPILVGGTHYYTQSLLFKNSLVSDNPVKQVDMLEEQVESKWPILSASTEEIYAKLEEVDPTIARRWHPNDRRHVQRSLEIWLQTGRKASEVYQEQEEHKRRILKDDVEAASEVADSTNGCEHLRYPSLVFWLHAQEEVLKARLDDRVQKMVASGLLEEASAMSAYFDLKTSQGHALDLGKGIWVSIGYKEMQPYIAMLQRGDSRQEDLFRVRDECIEAVIAHTRQYAKKQTRRIRLTLASLFDRAASLHRLFVLDCTDLDRWTDAVSDPSERIAEAFLKGNSLPEPSTLSSLADAVLASSRQGSVKAQRLVRECSVCQKVMMTEHEWKVHLSSTGHKRAIQAKRRRAENEIRRQAAAAARLEASDKREPLHNGEVVAGRDDADSP
jgi:tRNA dimethylallyltransferase